jgi:RNA polymerase sigma-70 factor (ECF subfamily)
MMENSAVQAGAIPLWRGQPGRAATSEVMAGQYPLATTSDQDLLSQAASGETLALGVLYDRYGRLVFSVALRVTGDRGAAEEVTQDTFLRLWQHAASYSASLGSLPAWLLTIAQRRAIDELRSRRGTIRRREIGLPEALPEHLALDPAALSQLRTDLQSALRELPHPQREAIELCFFGGLSRQEIAQRTASPLPTIHTRLRLGLDKLRAILLRGERPGTDDGA